MKADVAFLEEKKLRGACSKRLITYPQFLNDKRRFINADTAGSNMK